MIEYILCESSPAYSAYCFICLGKPKYIYICLWVGFSIVMVLPDIAHISLLDFFEQSIYLLKQDLCLRTEDKVLIDFLWISCIGRSLIFFFCFEAQNFGFT